MGVGAGGAPMGVGAGDPAAGTGAGMGAVWGTGEGQGPQTGVEWLVEWTRATIIHIDRTTRPCCAIAAAELERVPVGEGFRRHLLLGS